MADYTRVNFQPSIQGDGHSRYEVRRRREAGEGLSPSAMLTPESFVIPQEPEFDPSFGYDQRLARYLVCFWCVLCPALLLTVILLPLSFSGLEYFEVRLCQTVKGARTKDQKV
jgi:hypothetical protein